LDPWLLRGFFVALTFPIGQWYEVDVV